MIPEQKGNLRKLKWLNWFGLLYFMAVLAFIFLVTLTLTLEVVVEEESWHYYTWPGYFIVFNIVVNFLLVRYNDSVYTGRDSENVTSGLLNMDWRKCVECEQAIPPRAHHCVLCGKCILKRDHHCFFTGSCVGFANQRYFVVYCLYCAVGCVFAFYINWQYVVIQYPYPLSWDFYSYILPVTILQWILGYYDFAFVWTVVLLYACTMTAFGAGGIFAWQMFMVATGLTTHEYTNTGVSRTWKGIQRRLREVFGPYWLLNFVVPLPFLKTNGNGVDWDTSKNV